MSARTSRRRGSIFVPVLSVLSSMCAAALADHLHKSLLPKTTPLCIRTCSLPAGGASSGGFLPPSTTRSFLEVVS